MKRAGRVAGLRARLGVGLLLAGVLAAPSAAQEIDLRLGRSFLSPSYTYLWLGYGLPSWGPFTLSGSGLFYDADKRNLYGAGGELTAGIGHWSLLGDLALGFSSGDRDEGWVMWSLGVARNLLPGPLALGVEARYRRVVDFDDSGIELGLRLGIPIGGSGRRAGGGGGSRGKEDTGLAVASRSALADSVVTAALGAMEAPYLWGGSDANGFDCSGLVQWAYRRQGITLPRQSADQARAGLAVERAVEDLRPGDILAFAEAAGRDPQAPVTHVGLYLGERRFLHSTARGVRVSRLDPSDPVGRWWVERWVGARRVLGQPG